MAACWGWMENKEQKDRVCPVSATAAAARQGPALLAAVRSGVCMVWKGNKRQMFVGSVSETLLQYFWAPWLLLLALWQQTTAGGWPSASICWSWGSGRDPTAQCGRLCWEGCGAKASSRPLELGGWSLGGVSAPGGWPRPQRVTALSWAPAAA